MTLKRAFMVMPFSDEIAAKAYKLCVLPVCKELGVDIRPANEILGTRPIYDDILAEINQATVVIADVSGKNPNVFYELGIAHTLKRNRTIILTHESPETAPFDIAHFRMFHYHDSMDGPSLLTDWLRKTIQFLLEDLVYIHREEFEVTYRVIQACQDGTILCAIVGLSQIPTPLSAETKRFHVEGQTDDSGTLCTGTCSSFGVSHFLQPAIAMQYVQPVGSYIQLTELGKAFAQFLLASGVRCHILNDHKLTEGYIPMDEQRTQPE